MSNYLNIYLVERETKEKKYLKSYGGSSVIYSIFDQALDPPYAYKEISDEKQEIQYMEVTNEDIERVRNILTKNYKDLETVRKNNEKTYEESKKIFIEVLAKKENISLYDLKDEIDRFAWDKIDGNRDDDSWESELNYADGELSFYETLYDEFKYIESSPFCAIAVNVG